MRDLNKDISGGKTEEKISVEHSECEITVRKKKVLPSKKPEKIYKVTITYIHVTDEEAKIKRAIIESIIRKG